MTEPVALLVVMRSRLPDQLGAFEEQLLVQVLPRAGQDRRSVLRTSKVDTSASETSARSSPRA